MSPPYFNEMIHRDGIPNPDAIETLRIYTCGGVRAEDYYDGTTGILDEMAKKLKYYTALGYVIEFDNCLELAEKLKIIEERLKNNKKPEKLKVRIII